MTSWLSDSAGRAKFVCQLYNLRHMLEGDEEAEDTYAKVAELKEKIEQHAKEFHIRSFFPKNDQGTNNSNGTKRRRLHDDAGNGSGRGGARGADAAVSHSYGVSAVGPEQGIHREESPRGIERARDPQISKCLPASARAHNL